MGWWLLFASAIVTNAFVAGINAGRGNWGWVAFNAFVVVFNAFLWAVEPRRAQ